MVFGEVTFDERIKDSIKNYSLVALYEIDLIKKQFELYKDSLGVELCLVGRHGESFVATLEGFGVPDVEKEPGEKIRVYDRTVGHLYAALSQKAQEDEQVVNKVVALTKRYLEQLGEAVYFKKEASVYISEVQAKSGNGSKQGGRAEREDALTGVFNKPYFMNRLGIVDRSETVPVAIVNVNINDWKYVNDNFGDEESDRLIATVADFIKKCSKPEYIIGRVDGDVFIVLIPLAEDGEAEEFKAALQDMCHSYDDPHIAPSVAVGVVYKTNVEETIEDKLSDAEYEMLENKFELKNAPGYRERLEKA